MFDRRDYTTEPYRREFAIAAHTGRIEAMKKRPAYALGAFQDNKRIVS
jgi:hypothetical protein